MQGRARTCKSGAARTPQTPPIPSAKHGPEGIGVEREQLSDVQLVAPIRFGTGRELFHPAFGALCVMAVCLVFTMGCAVATLAGVGGQTTGASENKPGLPLHIATGKQLFQQHCTSCHGVQGDRMPVSPLFAKGFLQTRGDATLMLTISEGKGAMPAKGGNAALTDYEVKAAVDYLLGLVR